MELGKTKTSRPQPTRDEILRVGTDLIGRQGYNRSGLGAILRAAKVPKGSFYHYFPSKEDFGLAVIDEFASEYENKLRRFLVDGSGSPLTRLKSLWQASIDSRNGEPCPRGCLIGTLGQEMAGQHERFRERLDTVFRSWEDRIATCLQEAQEAGELRKSLDAKATARVLLAGWEGAILRAKVTKTTQPMEDFVSMMFDQVLKT